MWLEYWNQEGTLNEENKATKEKEQGNLTGRKTARKVLYHEIKEKGMFQE